MRNLSSTFRRLLYYNDRNYDCTATITLSNSMVLTFTNSTLWSSGFEMDDAVSEDNSFTALGSVIIGSASIIINNMDDTYSDYDFINAKVVLSLSKSYVLDNNSITEPIRMGTYTVDDANYNGSTIKLLLLDYMEQFDRPYSQSSLIYPATLDSIVRDACLSCGVTLNTYDFPHKNYIVQTRPDDETLTFREVIGWAATIAGCFARCDAYGRLELKWFDTDTLMSWNDGLDGGIFDSSNPYSTGDNADGGSFNPWNTGDEHDGGSFSDIQNIHYLTNLYSQNIGIDNVVITGIRITIETENETSGNIEDKEYLFGSAGYIIDISNNAFITKTTVNDIGSWLSQQLVGLTFRTVNITHLSDPSIEAGDIGIVIDRKGNEYPILITRTSFSADRLQTTVCGAESVLKNNATRYSDITKSYVASRKLLNKEQTAREQALENLSRALAAKSGLYSTVESTGSGNIYYLHDKPLLEDSAVVWKMTAEAWGVTTNYDGDDTVWNGGMTVDGDVIARILDADGINARWINTGSLSVKKTISGVERTLFEVDIDTGYFVIRDNSGNVIFEVDATTRALTITPTTFTLTSANLDTIDNAITGKGYQTATQVTAAVSAGWTNLTQNDVFTKLTGGGANQGIYLDSGNVYVNASAINSGTISADRIGANSITAGKLSVSDLYAIGATIGGFTIGSNIIYARYDFAAENTYCDFMINKYLDAQTKAISVSKTNKSTLVVTDFFYVNYAGKLYAKDAEIIGTVNATNGSFTGKVYGNGKAVYNDSTAGYCLEQSGNFGVRSANGAYMLVDGNGIQFSSVYFGERAGGSGFPATIDSSGNANLVDLFCRNFTVGDPIQTEAFSVDTQHAYLPRIGATNTLMTTSTGMIYGTSSSKRYKNIKSDFIDIEPFYQIRAKTAKYKPGYLPEGHEWEGKYMPMLIAEDVDEICHEAATHNADGQVEDWNHRVIIPVHQQMLVEQHNEIECLKLEIKELKQQINELKSILLEGR